jgi:hypothetical protein
VQLFDILFLNVCAEELIASRNEVSRFEKITGDLNAEREIASAKVLELGEALVANKNEVSFIRVMF